MLTNRKNFLETLKKNGCPDRLCAGYTPFAFIEHDPILEYLLGNRIPGTDTFDRWGTCITFPKEQPAAMPHVTADNQVIQDIEEWRQYVKVPDLATACSGKWDQAKKSRSEIDTKNCLATSFMFTGIFEQCHMLMTFEDTLANFLMYPEEMHELIDVITEYRLNYMKLLVENLKPEVVISHDDWGSQNSMLMSPDTWRTFLKEPYRRLYQYLHDNGVIVIHHADSYLEPIAVDMEEIGIDVWQGVLPSNDILKISKGLKGTMTLMGGIDSGIDRADVTVEEIRKEVRRVCETYGKLPHFIPSMTYGDPGTINPMVQAIVLDEIERFNAKKVD